MIRLRAGKTGGKAYDVFVGRNKRKTGSVSAVWALWNGGPGIVEYMPTRTSGAPLLNFDGDGVAVAYLFGLVRVVERT